MTDPYLSPAYVPCPRCERAGGTPAWASYDGEDHDVHYHADLLCCSACVRIAQSAYDELKAFVAVVRR